MKPIVLSMGDPAGIGPELIAATWRALEGSIPFVVVGCAAQMEAQEAPVARITKLSDLPPNALPVLDHPLPSAPTPGVPDPAHAPHIIDWIQKGVALCQIGEASALATAPINKKALMEGAGFTFPGHTEFLAALTGAPRPVMMLTGGGLRVVPVTIHIALDAVQETLTEPLLEETIRVTHRALRETYGIANPRLAVAGLNPHAGEQGAMGREEITLIAPVLERLRAEGFDLHGPLPADTMFHDRARTKYDVALCMYHDQALIPIKTLAFDEGVNVTLGLPIVRTSPDHGTAYDIAGKGIARPDSLIAAIREAALIAQARA
ncbi:MAG: 4-hydroxythreonine-4-phosphate dehydrogenase PdxA [Pseudomonadota bacterium]